MFFVRGSAEMIPLEKMVVRRACGPAALTFHPRSQEMYLRTTTGIGRLLQCRKLDA